MCAITLIRPPFLTFFPSRSDSLASSDKRIMIWPEKGKNERERMSGHLLTATLTPLSHFIFLLDWPTENY